MHQDDRFTARRVIGQGSSAEVFSTWDELTEREAALKLFFRAAGIPRRELTVGRILIHRNIIQIHELIEEDGRFGIVMELAPGGNLRTRLKAGPMPLAACRPIWKAVLAALQAAHAKKIVHRDVKPENIVFGADGPAKLTDFGHAWLLETGDSDYTDIGAGTPGYMAPEKESTPRSDIYSFGVAAYEMLAGGLPETTPLPDGIPWHIRRILSRCIQRDPSKRPQSVTELIRLLKGPVLLRPVPALAAMAVIMSVGTIGFGTLWWGNAPPTARLTSPIPAHMEAVKRPTVAVFFDGATGLGFMQALAKSGQFQVVERAELQRALAEMKLGDYGLVTMETAQHAGRIVGAQYLLFGVVQPGPRQIHVAARLVETETLFNVKTDVVEGGPDDDEVELARNLALRFRL